MNQGKKVLLMVLIFIYKVQGDILKIDYFLFQYDVDGNDYGQVVFLKLNYINIVESI